jgi:hypothetical protein
MDGLRGRRIYFSTSAESVMLAAYGKSEFLTIFR